MVVNILLDNGIYLGVHIDTVKLDFFFFINGGCVWYLIGRNVARIYFVWLWLSFLNLSGNK